MKYLNTWHVQDRVTKIFFEIELLIIAFTFVSRSTSKRWIDKDAPQTEDSFIIRQFFPRPRWLFSLYFGRNKLFAHHPVTAPRMETSICIKEAFSVRDASNKGAVRSYFQRGCPEVRDVISYTCHACFRMITPSGILTYTIILSVARPTPYRISSRDGLPHTMSTCVKDLFGRLEHASRLQYWTLLFLWTIF